MMWEPFTEPARRAMVRAQEVAQMFASNHIGNEHIAFALAEKDDAVGRVLATAIDRDALRELLDGARTPPSQEMEFTAGAKHTIESAFQNARRLRHDHIGVAHIALGLLDGEATPLRSGTDVQTVRAQLDAAAGTV